ncbi:CPBP family intramembrane glutamic endopeptidase [Glaciihabitans sp. UYNi722]|uniref:CPBP family intramembrane glutamic endopeptidase n=1 Tax=Glaciihabitans sp. UYNi722 TaxID=3156344 RepID=UPI0033977417
MEFSYHRLARSSPSYRWWKPLIVALIAIGFYVALTIILVVLFVIAALAVPSISTEMLKLVSTGVIDNSSPVILAFSLGSVALILPAIWCARLIMGPRPVGLLSSVAGRLRWRWMLRLLVPVVVAYGASTLFSSLLLPLLLGEPLTAPAIRSDTWIIVIVAVLLVPLQATAEEFFFRGYLMQTFGGWLRHPLFAILLPIPFFTFGHDYDIWGLLDVTVFGVTAAWLVWRTGGLEASIVAHVVNNTVIFVMGGFGLVNVDSKTGSWGELVVSAVTLALYSWLVLVAAKRFGIARTRVVGAPLPEPAPLPA